MWPRRLSYDRQHTTRAGASNSFLARVAPLPPGVAVGSAGGLLNKPRQRRAATPEGADRPQGRLLLRDQGHQGQPRLSDTEDLAAAPATGGKPAPPVGPDVRGLPQPGGLVLGGRAGRGLVLPPRLDVP